MHAIHHTEAVILKSVPSGETNMRVWLFTKQFGLIIALVQGVRKPGAKLQSHIVEYSFISADLIQGREVWRLISATQLYNPLVGKHRSPLARAYVRTLTMINRFLAGEEEQHTELFDHIKECAAVLIENTQDPKLLDAVSLWKVLVLLGYIAPLADESSIITTPLIKSLNNIDSKKTGYFVNSVKNAIIESHL